MHSSTGTSTEPFRDRLFGMHELYKSSHRKRLLIGFRLGNILGHISLDRGTPWPVSKRYLDVNSCGKIFAQLRRR